MPFDTALPKSDYLIMSRNAYTPMLEASAWALNIRHALPVVLFHFFAPTDVPLNDERGDANRLRARYDLRIDYSANPEPPLSPDRSKWAKRFFKNIIGNQRNKKETTFINQVVSFVFTSYFSSSPNSSDSLPSHSPLL